jgi:ketosteroid isomerase-like protein
MSDDERAVRAVLDEFAAALHEKNAARVIATLADEAVAYDLAPPLRIGPETLHDAARLQTWFAAWAGPIESRPQDFTIAVSGDIAFAYGLRRMSGTKTDGRAESYFGSTSASDGP